jgi:hypothetical protein
VGFNPLRRYRGNNKSADITILIVFLIVIAVLVAWATR